MTLRSKHGRGRRVSLRKTATGDSKNAVCASGRQIKCRVYSHFKNEINDTTSPPKTFS
uniref:Uncharacterized protein n=1 Tax=Meloidogyne enterolobii TaxID=390850 RepID=A0A6V7UDN0_MELEN|nr:unnamed protein product [Meloidogyne enterolobii]